jgi:sterol-4alpha-carboxylate 3-dehydrogenase (decarboxylating)
MGLIMGWISEWLIWIRSTGRNQPNMTVEAIRFSTIHRTLSMEKAKEVLSISRRWAWRRDLREGWHGGWRIKK